MTSIARRIWRLLPLSLRSGLLTRVVGSGLQAWWSAQARATLLRREARLGLVRMGFNRNREVIVVRCAGGEIAAGLFAEFATVVGALEFRDRWASETAGLRVDFADQGLYHAAGRGPNWWEYYFESISIGSDERRVGQPKVSELAQIERDFLAHRVQGMSRQRASRVVHEYIRPLPCITEAVDAFAKEHFSGRSVLGVHYRGTDKELEAPRVPYERVGNTVRQVIREMGGEGACLFLASDEQAFIEYMRGAFPGQVRYRDIPRSTDGEPMHLHGGGVDRHGEDALIDCLLLAKAGFVVRTASNLGLCAGFFNPDATHVLLNQEY